MRQMGWMSLFQWYGMFTYWNYAALSIARSAWARQTSASPPFDPPCWPRSNWGLLQPAGLCGGLCHGACGAQAGRGRVHMAALRCAGSACFCCRAWGRPPRGAPALLRALAMPELGSHLALLIPALGLGLGWASIMGNPYVILAGAIPAQRTGVTWAFST
jgi:maltose/moltooligosaccharide transporter